VLSVPVRHIGRKDNAYGYEEGHGTKNEVRKDRWIRKRRIKTAGQEWREEQGLVPNPFRSHALVTTPDWKFKDGRPGYLTQDQAEAVAIMKDLCQDVHEALKLMKKV